MSVKRTMGSLREGPFDPGNGQWHFDDFLQTTPRLIAETRWRTRDTNGDLIASIAKSRRSVRRNIGLVCYSCEHGTLGNDHSSRPNVRRGQLGLVCGELFGHGAKPWHSETKASSHSLDQCVLNGRIRGGR